MATQEITVDQSAYTLLGTGRVLATLEKVEAVAFHVGGSAPAITTSARHILRGEGTFYIDTTENVYAMGLGASTKIAVTVVA